MIFVSLNKKLSNKVLLLILDGWGIASDKKVSAPDIAKTPNYNSLKDKNPFNYLITHGEKVGLPLGQMGNSEVGHMNIGSGRIVPQDLLRIDKSIKNGQFLEMKELKEIISHSKNKASITTGFPASETIESSMDFLKDLKGWKKVRMFGSAALSCAYVASGKCDYYAEKGVFLWDFAAGICLVKEAGGNIAYSLIDNDRYEVIASNGLI